MAKIFVWVKRSNTFLLLWGDLAKAVAVVTPTHQSRNGSTIFREKKEDRKSFPPAAL